MAQIKCDYCGKMYDEEKMQTLDNGCPACPECVADEEKRIEERAKKESKQ